MKTAKQISVVLEQIKQVRDYQSFDKGPHDSGEGPWLRHEALPTKYQVVAMKNAVVLDFGSLGPNNLNKVRVGDMLTEAQAEEIARCKVFEVTIRA